MENTTDSAIGKYTPDADGCVTIGNAVFWPTYEQARIHRTHDSTKGCWVIRWIKSRDSFITLYC